jgi:hypothetical protein
MYFSCSIAKGGNPKLHQMLVQRSRTRMHEHGLSGIG